jgi:spermidine synthase
MSRPIDTTSSEVESAPSGAIPERTAWQFGLGSTLGLMVLMAAVFSVLLLAPYPFCPPATAAAGTRSVRGGGVLETEVKSEFSRIRVRRQGSIRTLLFVRDSGEEVVESMLNVKKPHDLLVPYQRYMFASYLFRPKQERVLLVGLGGGGMVHFLKHYDPAVRVDAVEIDPAIVKIAEGYFGVRSGGNVNIVTADGLQYLEKTDQRYDVIYLDAFLKPAPDTDPTGMPLRLKTLRFYKDIQGKLKPDGLVVFNLNPHEGIDADIKTIRSAFAQVYVFRIADSNVVVVGSLAQQREQAAALKARAQQADHRFKATFSFAEMLRNLAR